MRTIESIKRDLLPIFEREPVYRVVLFGSFAKGTANDKSDIDLVLDSRGKLIGMGFYRVLEEIVNALNADVDLIEISQLTPGTPIFEAIEKEGIVIYDAEIA